MELQATRAGAVQPTPRQLLILKTVADFQASRCYSPTIAELACELDISRSTAFEHIEQLRRKGMLSASPGRARSLRLTSGARRLLERVRSGGSTFRQVAAGAIPLVGVVAAGLPTEAVENTEHLSFAGCFGGGGGDIFALEVRGDSMIGRDIREGDYVVCRRSAAAENGQLVVAILDEEEATLKRFYRDRAHARLEPANDDYETVYSDNCRIEGVVVGLIRRL